MVDPDLELREGEDSFALLALLASLPSMISSFLPKIREDADPSPRSATGHIFTIILDIN